MKKIFLLAAVVALLGLGIFGAIKRQEARRARDGWAAVIPEQPSIPDRPAELRSRIETLETRLKAWPPDVAALGALARVDLANGYEKAAEQALRGLLVYDPQNAHWPHYLASLLAGYGRLDDAIPLWRQVATLAPDYLPARLRLAQALLKSNQLDESQRWFSSVLEKNPNEPYALLGLAQIDVQRSGWGSARDRLQAIIVANPDFSAAYHLLATVAERLGDLELAARARAQAANLGRFRDLSDPWEDELVDDCFDVYRLQVLASTISATGGGLKAVPLLERALTISPKDVRTHRQLGRLYFSLQESEKAQAQLEEAIGLQPNDPSAYIDLVSVFRARKDVAAAVSLLESGIQMNPQSDGLQMEMAQALMAEGQVESALPYLQRARQLAPDNGAVYEEFALAYFRLGRKNEGGQALRDGLQRNPDYAPLVVMMARYSIQSGDRETAQKLIHRAGGLNVTPQEIANLSHELFEKFGDVAQ